MSINVGQVSTNLSDGERFYAYSGVVVGDITSPASITLISIPNTGLKDSFIKIQPSYGEVVADINGEHLGISVSIDGIEVVNTQRYRIYADTLESFDLFIPRQSSFTILSLNTAANNTQERGVTVLGWRL